MKQLKKIFVLVLLTAGCAHQEKPEEISATMPPPPPDVKIEDVSLRSARANMKLKKKVLGLINFAQNDDNIKVEVQMEGLRSGPYELHLADKESCHNPSLKRHGIHDLAQVIADKNGVVKATVEFTHMQTKDLVGHTLVLHVKNKRFPKAAACGVVEKI